MPLIGMHPRSGNFSLAIAEVTDRRTAITAGDRAFLEALLCGSSSRPLRALK